MSWMRLYLPVRTYKGFDETFCREVGPTESKQDFFFVHRISKELIKTEKLLSLVCDCRSTSS